MDTENNRTLWIVIGVAVLILIIGGAWMLARRGSASGAGANATSTAATSTATTTKGTGASASVSTTAHGETLAVHDQSAGTSVTVAGLNLSRASWVAVRDATHVLGAAWFPAGATGGVVHLLRATTAGQTYSVVVFVDNGDKKFDMHKDAQVDGVAGTFKAQ